jgi:hypothetical protein
VIFTVTTFNSNQAIFQGNAEGASPLVQHGDTAPGGGSLILQGSLAANSRVR